MMNSYERAKLKKDPNWVEPTLENVYAALRAEVDEAKAKGEPTWISAYYVEYRLTKGPTDPDKVRRLLNQMVASNQGQPGSVIKWDWKAAYEAPTRFGRRGESYFSLLGEAKSAREIRLERSSAIRAGQYVVIKGNDIHNGEQTCRVLEGTDENGDITVIVLARKRVYSGDVILLPDDEL